MAKGIHMTYPYYVVHPCMYNKAHVFPRYHNKIVTRSSHHDGGEMFRVKPDSLVENSRKRHCARRRYKGLQGSARTQA